MNVTLETVTGAYVKSYEIFIPFQRPPDVLTWGNRIFVFNRSDESRSYYREGFSFPIIAGHTARECGE